MASSGGSRVGPWLLVDSVVGWQLRGELAERIAAAEHEAALARYEAELARYERDRLRDRRAVRLATTVASGAGRDLVSLPARLRDAARARPEPEPPSPPPSPGIVASATTSAEPSTIGTPDTSDTRGAADTPDVEQLRADAVARRARVFPHLRVLHLGAAQRFASLAPHTPVDPDAWHEQLDAGADVLLLEPPGDDPDWDPLDGDLPRLLGAAEAAGIPAVRIALPGGSGGRGLAAVELVEGGGAGDTLVPSVDTTLFNPVGWRLRPSIPVAAFLQDGPDEVARDLLAGFDPPVALLHPPDVRPPESSAPRRRIEHPDALRASLGRCGVLLDHPAWHGDAVAAQRLWLAALACGVPVVTIGAEPPAEVLAGLPDTAGAVGSVDGLPPGVLLSTAADAPELVHKLLIDADVRERHAIAGRRWALNSASREVALRRILGHLDVPVPPPPRTTVLLATNRPEQLEHALASVARQTQPDVDVALVLHGEPFTDVDAPGRDEHVSSVVRAPGTWTLGDCLNAALDHAGGELVAKMDDDDHYGPAHLTDLVAAWHYSGAEVVGKRVEYIHLAARDITLRRTPSQPERDRPHVGGPTLLAARELVREHRFLRVPNRVDSTFYERVRAAGGRIFGIHTRDLVLQRHGNGHAWTASDASFLDEAVEQREGLALDLASSDPADAG